ncbi:hypothetical protein EJB05_16014 [Eragrostis curvula]|uniref:C3H1-type domain-containing protein n=1 Tax=Eragrostis curvula TaxID=38414 RepID=A0A5J9VDQ4_9POAL|nr:hypothetical protein EJB05_16014 [Eragrostis curvula]
MEDALAPPPDPLAATDAAVLTRRRSHLDSASYRTLSRLFAHCFHLHPSRREAPVPPEAEPAAANPTGVESGDSAQAPVDADFDRRKDVEKEAMAAGSSPRQETVSPVMDQPAVANPTGVPCETPQCSLEDADEVVVKFKCSKPGAGVEDSGVGAGLLVEDEALKSMKSCLEGEIDESMEAVGDDDGQLLDAMMTNFTGLIDDVGAGSVPEQSCAIFGGELQNINEEAKQLGDGIEEDRPAGNSGYWKVDGGGFEEGEIEGELQELDAEESGDSKPADENADGEEQGRDSVSKGSGANESCDLDTGCGNVHLTPEIKRNGDLLLNKDARNDAQMCATRAQAISYDEVLDWNETPLPDDEDLKPGKKRKRNLTEERKAKKTKNKRMKRAQQRIAEGVHKPKLQPVIRPKEVKHCHFYNHGKCQQGDSCKFSHDFIPSTKSMACKHFASGSCLKGDDCPFDHELSKYPCHKYQSGKCIRGDKCKFSHVLSTTEGTSTTDAKKSDAPLAFGKTNLTGQAGSQKTSSVHNGEPMISATAAKQQHSILKTLAGISINSQNISTRIPKGVQFLPLGRGGSNSSSAHQDVLSVEKHRNANSSQHQYLGGHQAEGEKNVEQNGQKPVTLLCEKNSLKEATLPTDSTATPGSIHTQNEVSEASRILQDFLFGAGS